MVTTRSMTRTRNGRVGYRGYRGVVSAGVGAAGALYRGFRQYRSLRNMVSGKKQSNTGFITNQYDVKTQYRRRRMPRARRKRWVRFVNKVRSCTDKDFASQYQVLRSVASISGAQDTQASWSCGVYGQNGVPATATDLGSADLSDVNALTAAAGKNNIYAFKSAVLDCEITNSGSTSATVDCYEIICRKDLNTQNVSAVGPNDLFLKGFSSQDLLGTNSSISAAIPGATPFQNSLFASHFKILKKTRVLLSPGQVTHFSFRDAKDRLYKSEFISRAVIQRGMYHGFLFIVQGATDGTHFSSAYTVGVTAQRYYNYVIKDVNTIAAGYTNI